MPWLKAYDRPATASGRQIEWRVHNQANSGSHTFSGSPVRISDEGIFLIMLADLDILSRAKSVLM
jgi:hypothetical protein